MNNFQLKGSGSNQAAQIDKKMGGLLKMKVNQQIRCYEVNECMMRVENERKGVAIK